MEYWPDVNDAATKALQAQMPWYISPLTMRPGYEPYLFRYQTDGSLRTLSGPDEEPLPRMPCPDWPDCPACQQRLAAGDTDITELLLALEKGE